MHDQRGAGRGGAERCKREGNLAELMQITD